MEFDPASLFDRSPRTLAIAYLCLGALFVPLSDFAVAVATGTTGALGVRAPVRLIDGWLLVGASSLLLYGAAAHHRQRAVSARRDLETSNQQIQVLSRVFRHNVRNDLNIIQGYADLLADRVDDERSRECLETIRQTTDDVVAISEKLRVIEDASTDPPSSRIDLVETVREAAADVDGDGVCVSVESPSAAWIRADRSVEYPIREVFENAVTHNDGATCEVIARIETTETTTCLAVRDNGPGIPDDERAVLQAEEETPLSHASSIGLWLVKWMCETQGGTVGFETTDDGTTVRLRFESARVDAPPSDRDTDTAAAR
ncbi:histidine kinase [Halorubrum aidingense JCM 13560]|uniref:histidine kinase n=1 Tax=Halorubrum aidingense JCM 13560 TaxID=1230454 RepID=M0P9U4_9EURY|nr:HAMP domain-containing sensor histidine kinase [Halorubrum aidingense]EMA66608.1 histidine kinase [Halorubrum aidingense JCM 13560]